MHLQFEEKEEALEYIEVNSKKKEYPFIYDNNNPHDMEDLNMLRQEAVKFKSYVCSVGPHSYTIGNYTLED
jgi:hypothetical protein